MPKNRILKVPQAVDDEVNHYQTPYMQNNSMLETTNPQASANNYDKEMVITMTINYSTNNFTNRG